MHESVLTETHWTGPLCQRGDTIVRLRNKSEDSTHRGAVLTSNNDDKYDDEGAYFYTKSHLFV
jgi:hypothetical protein